jgi:hypothetical protein
MPGPSQGTHTQWQGAMLKHDYEVLAALFGFSNAEQCEGFAVWQERKHVARELGIDTSTRSCGGVDADALKLLKEAVKDDRRN